MMKGSSFCPYQTISLQDETVIFLVGTAHVSQKSVDDVIQSFNEVNPDVVCVELDSKRYENLKNQKQWQNSDLLSAILKGQSFLLLANLILLNYQHRMGEDLGIKPGSEMLKAIELAQNLSVPIVLCDRSIVITLKRAWRKSSFWSRIKILVTLIQCAFSKEQLTKEDLQKLQNSDAISEMLESLSHQVPVIKNVIIDERDVYLAKKIYTTQGKKKLVIIGAGHMIGVIETLRNLDEGLEIYTENLDTIPSKNWLSFIQNLIIPIAVITLFLLLAYKSGKGFNLNKIFIFDWFFWNMLLGAIGAILALAHPLVILTNTLLSPFTTLIPLVAAGPISAALQFVLKKPRIQDFENLRKLKGISSWYKNRISQILLTGFYSSLGSTLGGLIAFLATWIRSI